MKNFLLLLPLLVFATKISCQQLSEEEKKLYQLINEYRKQNNLHEIPQSPALTFVAQTHVKDLYENQPANKVCNLHSWSDKGKWKKCCYLKNHSNAECMWSKPRELTCYTGNGYEIAFYSSSDATAEEALQSWKTSYGHNNVILNEDIWRSLQWNAIGIGIYKNYAVVWFGEKKDFCSKSE